jgi:hypothetical protein
MLRRVVPVRIDVSEEISTSIIRVIRIGELVTTLAVTINRNSVLHSSLILVTLMMKEIRSSETSILSRTTRRNISEDGLLHSHRFENLKSYIALTDWAL